MMHPYRFGGPPADPMDETDADRAACAGAALSAKIVMMPELSLRTMSKSLSSMRLTSRLLILRTFIPSLRPVLANRPSGATFPTTVAPVDGRRLMLTPNLSSGEVLLTTAVTLQDAKTQTRAQSG
jgi:hypothetical protein